MTLSVYSPERYMLEAYKQAQIAYDRGEVPVGAVVVSNNRIIARAHNQVELLQDPTAHAEILAIRQACQLKKNWRLNDCTLYVTLEPCPMCTGAIIHARLSTVVYGVDDFKTGAIRTVMNLPNSYASNHHLEVIAGIRESQCRQLLQSWFQAKRKNH